MPMPHNSDDGGPRRALLHPGLKQPRRDLRYAAFVSLGLIGIVLVAGAAITPLVGLDDWPSFPSGGHDQLVRLGTAPPADVKPPQRTSNSDGTVDRRAVGGGGGSAAAAPATGAAPGAAIVPRARATTGRPLLGRAHDPAPQGRFP